jgi:hypothetical protein
MMPEELIALREEFWGRPGSHREKLVRALFKHIDDQAKRIAELEGNQCYSGACSYAVNYEEDMTTYRIRIDKQRAALKKLGQAKRARGKALVEERANRIAGQQSGDFVNVKGDHMYREVSPESCMVEARQQLRQEGKP